MPKLLLFTAIFVVFNCIITEAQVVRSSHHDELAAKTKGTLSTSKSSGSGAGGDLCEIWVDTSSYTMLSTGTAALCVGQTLTLSGNYSVDMFGTPGWYFNGKPVEGYGDGYSNYSIDVQQPGLYFFQMTSDWCQVAIEVTSIKQSQLSI